MTTRESLNAVLLAARSYQSALEKPISPAEIPAADEEASIRIELDGQALGRLVTPAVSAEIARLARRKKVTV